MESYHWISVKKLAFLWGLCLESPFERRAAFASHLGTSQSVVSDRPMLWECLSLNTRWLWSSVGISRFSTFGWIYFSIQLFQPCHHIWAVNLPVLSLLLFRRSRTRLSSSQSSVLLAEKGCMLEASALPALLWVTAELALSKSYDLTALTAS